MSSAICADKRQIRCVSGTDDKTDRRSRENSLIIFFWTVQQELNRDLKMRSQVLIKPW